MGIIITANMPIATICVVLIVILLTFCILDNHLQQSC